MCVCVCWYFIQVCGRPVDFVCSDLLSSLPRAEMTDTYPLLPPPHPLKWMPGIWILSSRLHSKHNCPLCFSSGPCLIVFNGLTIVPSLEFDLGQRMKMMRLALLWLASMKEGLSSASVGPQQNLAAWNRSCCSWIWSGSQRRCACQSQLSCATFSSLPHKVKLTRDSG